MPSKPVTLAAALLATSAFGGIAMDMTAQRSATLALDAAVAAHPGLAVASVEAQLLRGRVVLRGVEIGRTAAMRVSIGTLTLPMPSPGLGLIGSAMASPFDDKPAAAEAQGGAPDTDTDAPAPDRAPMAAPNMGNASASNVVVTIGTTTYKIKRIDLTGTTLSDADVVAMLDARSAEPLVARLKKLSAAAIVMPEVLVDDAVTGTERHVAVKQILLANVVAGKVANGSAGGLSFAIKDGDNATDGSFGSIAMAGLDLAQLAHVFGSLRTDESEAILPLYDMIGIDTIKLANVTRQTTLSIGALKQAGVKARALKNAPPTGTPPAGTPDEASAAFVDDLLHSFAVETIEATDLDATNDDPKGKSAFGAGAFAMHGFADGRIGDLGLRQFRFASAEMKMALAAIRFGDLSLPNASKGGAKKTFGGSLQIDGADIDSVTKDAAKPDAPPSSLKLKLAHLAFATDAIAAGALPPKSTLAMQHLVFEVPPGESPAKALYEMGYRQFDLSADVLATYDRTAQVLDIGKFAVTDPQMGSLSLGLTFKNVTDGILSPDPAISKVAAIAVLVTRLDLDVKNAGLFEKAIAWKAKTDSMTVAQERDAGMDFFANALPASVGNAPNAKVLGGAIAKFIGDPKTLHVALGSKSGIGAADMGMLATPDVLVNALDVKASAD